VLYSVFFIALGKTQSDYTYDHIIPYALNGGADVAIDDLREPLEVEAKIRYAHRAAAAVITPDAAGTVRIEFKEAQRAPAPGQAVVFYRGDTVIGGGTITDMEEPIC